MSFEKNSVFSDQLDSKKARGPSNKSKPPKKEPEGLDDLFGESSKKGKAERVDIKTW